MRSERKDYPLEAGADPRLLAFLDRLCEPLQRTLDDEELAHYRLQALGHLEMMAAELRDYDGMTPGAAVERALREYGQPDLLGIDLLDERCKGTRPVGFARGAHSATLWSFVWFGLASTTVLSLYVAARMIPGGGTLESTLPFADWIAPCVAGILTGRTVPTGNLRAVLLALLPLLFHAAATVALMEPSIRPDLRGALLVWPTLGGAATYLTALLRRRPRIVSHDRLAI